MAAWNSETEGQVNPLHEEMLSDMECDEMAETEEQTLSEMIEEWQDVSKVHSYEGERGVKNLNKLCKAIGYREDGFAYGSSLERFLGDNSGAIEAIIEWIGEQDCHEWREEIEIELPEKE